MKHERLKILILIFFLIGWLSGITYAEEFKFIEPTKGDKCPVCGMFVYKYPQWIAEIVFKDGTYAVFDGPKDMFKYYFNISKYNKSRTKEDIAEIYATEYYTTKRVKAKDVYFVIGSDSYGPMGDELIPIKGKKEAETFAKEHKGGKILTFDQISPEDVQ
ncbi:MAG: nitrous oxide reductase accessory protein NosL [Thermodesulfovibrionia bacterium]|nr:nitrous oxide reductase accessory protein NosL [Thermodesulfovibrionia bacterium]